MNLTELRPLGDRLLLRVLGDEHTVDETEGGIIIPDMSRDVHQRHMQFEIVSVGESVTDPTLLPGMRIIARPLRGVNVRYGDETFHICMEEDVEAILDI